MRSERSKTALRCAVYTRVSTEHGQEHEFNSLDNQREASEAYVKSQAHEGWKLIRTHYDDGGYSGGSMDRPALQRLLDDVRARRIDVIVVYKVDRLTRSLADFAKQRISVATAIGRRDSRPPPYVAKIGAGSGMSFASFLRFWRWRPTGTRPWLRSGHGGANGRA